MLNFTLWTGISADVPVLYTFIMKRILIALSLFIFTSVAYSETNRIKFLLGKLYDGGKSDYVMIFAHRGDWRNAPENSLLAYKNCIDRGLDGIEVDCQMTKDSVIVMMHDTTLDRTTTGHGKVSDYTLKELKNLFLRFPIGVVTRQKIPTFDEVLELCKGKILIQVDKWKPVKEQVVKSAKRHGCLDQIILRGTEDSQSVHSKYGKLLDGLTYIPVLVCKGHGDDEKLNDFMDHIKTPVISLSFKKDDYPVLRRVPEIRQRGFRIWYNSLWADFNAGHDDELAWTNLDASYGWLLRKGANIIFSDHPFLLLSYLERINRR